MARLLPPKNKFVGLLTVRACLQHHGSRNPQGINLYATVALILLGMPEFEEFGAVLDMVRIGVGKRNDIEEIPLRILQLFLESCFQIYFRPLALLRLLTVAIVHQDTLSVLENDLAGVAVAYRVKDDSMRHFLLSGSCYSASTAGKERKLPLGRTRPRKLEARN